jgi:hypothetical protein
LELNPVERLAKCPGRTGRPFINVFVASDERKGGRDATAVTVSSARAMPGLS